MKKLSMFVLSLATALSLVACGADDQQEENEEATAGNLPGTAETEELTSIDIMLDWYPNAVHSYLYAALEEGYFEEEGLDVKIVFPANPTDPINLAASGGVTLGITYQPDVIMARTKDVPVVSIAAIVRSPLNHMMVMADSDIESPSDLEGKTVGFPGIPVNEPILKTMVEADGGDYNQVNLMDVGFELGSSIVSERVDAVIGTYINHEYPVLKHQGHEIRYFNPIDYGVPAYYELVIVTNEDNLEEKREEIEAFWRAAVKGYEKMKNSPAESLDILFANQDQANFPLIREVEDQSLEILLSKMETENESFGSQTKESWQEVIDWLLSAGLIEEAPEVTTIFENITE
ncbi:ABC transporter substrate-binding protein [Alkalihalobacterium chitinilyticum]|uniref:ABC transporter substrate-binding protein n=1 Tax=Alkalihalobacterium chitinilyticum TaxID=2980103 RepID=A0ABT5VCJ3_9BACI|nr:ABC transporter substrate-binding protein [Alkalihalobacterium chitinilyticum]MDE5413169.1 ABC transporter substrate-binding protein [Alkalihalobacterium chitinilyticum]